MLFTLLLVQIPAVCAQAQEQPCKGRIAGKVVNSYTRQPIAGASVQQMNDSSKALVTNADGTFALNQCERLAQIIISKAGFKDAVYTLPAGEEKVLPLIPETLELATVTVTDERISTGNAATTLATVSDEALTRKQGKGLAEVLGDISGVQVLRNGATIAKPIIQGLHGNRILILNNGIRQEGQQWGLDHAPEIDPFMASQLTVVKGAAAVQYGAEAIGGVVLVNPPKLPTQAGIRTMLHLQGASNGRQGIASGQVSGYHSGIGWRAQLTRKRSGNVHTPNYFLANTGVSETNFSLAAGYQKERYGAEVFFSRFNTDLGIFRGAHIGNLTDLQFAISSPRPVVSSDFSYQIDNPRQAVTHSLLKINGYWKKSQGEWQWQYGFQHNKRQEFDIRRGGRDNIPALDLNLFTHTLDAVYEAGKGSAWQWKAGFNGIVQSNLNTPGTGIRPLVPNYWVTAAGTFAIWKYSATRWDAEAGIRYDLRHMEVRRFDRNNVLQRTERLFNNISATVGAAYYVSEKTTLRSQLASAWRPPAPNELYSEGLHHGAAALEFGSDSLKSEQSWKWTNGISLKTDNISLEISGFAQYIGNYIYLAPQGETRLTIRGAFPVFHFEQTNARLAGADLTLHWQPWAQWETWLKGSMVRARDLTNGAFLPWIPPDQASVSLRRNLLLPSESRWKGAYASLSCIVAAQQWRVDVERDFAPPPRGYTLLNFDSGIRYEHGRQALHIGFSVHNLTNVAYRDYMNRFRYFADEQGRNFQLYLKYTL
ncbi:MAG: TonB-dependent receptor [Cytophagales bacterium]|nr:TonB-dependent receptor [Cytophagales bacterium]